MRQLVDEAVDRPLRAARGPRFQAFPEKHDEHRLGGGQVLADRKRGAGRDHDGEVGGDLALEELGDRAVEGLVAR